MPILQPLFVPPPEGRDSLDPATTIKRRQTHTHTATKDSSFAGMTDADGAPGRGSQVIKVVMPTYIMAPTEDERFRRKKVCKIIAECLQKELDGKEYDEDDCKTWSTTIAEAVKARIRQDCNFPRYKIVAQTFIGQQKLQDVRIASRCLWDNDYDNHASAVFNSQHIWATCLVFGFYAD